MKKLSLALCLLYGYTLFGGDSAITLEGKVLSLDITSIEAGAVVSKGNKRTPLQQLRSLSRNTKFKPEKGIGKVHLRNGGLIPASTISLGNNQVVFHWVAKTTLPSGSVHAIELVDGGDGRVLFQKALDEASTDDQIIVSAKTGFRLLKGVVLALGKDHLKLEYKGKTRKVGIDKVHGVVLAGKPDKSDYQYRVQLADGALIHSNALAMKDGSLSVEIAKGVAAKRSWDTVVRVAIMSDKLVFLSDLKPISAKQTPIVTYTSTWQKDKNLFGKPITIGKNIFEKGIGVHSHSILKFSAKGYKTFAATIGIDAGAKGKGDCIFRVLGDGKKLFEKRVKGTDKGHAVTIDLKGAEEITLEVAPGENLDVADHGNWADARFLK